MQQSRLILKGKYFIAQLPDKKYKGTRILLEYLPSQRIAFKPVKTSHVFRSDKSIAFNHELILNFAVPYFDIIYINYRGRYLWTSRQSILNNGVCRTYPGSNLETQIFLKIDLFKSTRDEAVEEMKAINFTIANETKRELKKSPGELDLFESEEDEPE